MIDYSPTNGYVTVEINGNRKTAHLGMGFIKILKDEFDLTLTKLGEDMSSGLPHVTTTAFSLVLYCGFKSFDTQHRNEINYTPELCLEWAFHMDEVQAGDFQQAMIYCCTLNQQLESMGKTKPTENRLQKT